jgi:choloylglycine hydrolase
MRNKRLGGSLLWTAALGAAVWAAPVPVDGCTGVSLQAANGDGVYGRTMEWGSTDMMSRLVVYPRNHRYQAKMPPGLTGFDWTGKYGIAGIDMFETGCLADGMNEAGLTVGLFYHPGYAEYADSAPALAGKCMAPTDVVQYLLSSCATVAEVRRAFDAVTVIKVVEETLGFPAPIHLLVTDLSGRRLVIEWRDGRAVFFDAPLGVLTNAPTYDWHLTNLRNYVNLSPVALPDRRIEDLDFRPLGGGSGMIGLPGDFTPPSRFVRAVAFSSTARQTPDGAEAIYELFRILDNFNVPLGAAESDGKAASAGMRSATIWTSGHHPAERILYYHTQHNRRVRMVDLKRIDFGGLAAPLVLPLDKVKAQSVEDRTP